MEIERVPFGQSHAEKIRVAHYKWLNMPAGLTPELSSKFMLGFHGGKTVRDRMSNVFEFPLPGRPITQDQTSSILKLSATLRQDLRLRKHGKDRGSGVDERKD